MPFHLPPVSRRQFLAGSFAAGLSTLQYPQRSWAAESANPDHWTLISDTHIDQDPATVARGANMAENLRRVANEMLELPERPAGVILSGDCAHREGNLGDYARLAELLAPLSKAGWPIHMMMGNHDDRVRFRQGFAQQISRSSRWWLTDWCRSSNRDTPTGFCSIRSTG